jgi:hypothetical protein
MISAAFSAIITVGAPVWPPGILGITEESATRSPTRESIAIRREIESIDRCKRRRKKR